MHRRNSDQRLPATLNRVRKYAAMHAPRITQIKTWVECFSTYTSVIVSQDPSRIQDLLAYLSTIVHAVRKYKGSGWQTYDAIFRQQAVNVNTSLWTTVLCNASPQEHCSTCLSLDHTLKDCPQQQGSKIIDPPSAPHKSDSLL